MKSRHKKTGLALILALGLTVSVATRADDDHGQHGRAETTDYALILPANLPHILRTANTEAVRLKLNESQHQAVREMVAEAPLKVFARLIQAEKLEKAIAASILFERARLPELQTRLDELASLKRQATEAQIATLNRLQGTLTPEQFRQLLELGNVRREP